MAVGEATLPAEMVSSQDGLSIKQLATGPVQATMPAAGAVADDHLVPHHGRFRDHCQQRETYGDVGRRRSFGDRLARCFLPGSVGGERACRIRLGHE
jgi:hypothetical protein